MQQNGSGYTLMAIALMWVWVGCGPSKPPKRSPGDPQTTEMNGDDDKTTGFAKPPEEVEPADQDIEVPPAP